MKGKLKRADRYRLEISVIHRIWWRISCIYEIKQGVEEQEGEREKKETIKEKEKDGGNEI